MKFDREKWKPYLLTALRWASGAFAVIFLLQYFQSGELSLLNPLLDGIIIGVIIAALDYLKIWEDKEAARREAMKKERRERRERENAAYEAAEKARKEAENVEKETEAE